MGNCNILTSLLCRNDVFEEVDADLLIGQQIETNVNGKEVIDFSLANVFRFRVIWMWVSLGTYLYLAANSLDETFSRLSGWMAWRSWAFSI